MKDESPAVAGRLTGKWRFKCVGCGTVHQQEGTIRRCADRFVSSMIRGNVTLGSLNMFHVGNMFEAARKGLLARYSEVSQRVGLVEAEQFRLNADLFCRVETQQEAARLVLNELKLFVDKRTEYFDPIFKLVDEFRRELDAAPNLDLGDRVEVTWRGQNKQLYRGHNDGLDLMVDGVEIPTQAVREYYAYRIENSVARRRLLSGWMDLVYLNVQEDRVVFGRYSASVAVKPAKSGKLEGRPFKCEGDAERWVDSNAQIDKCELS